MNILHDFFEIPTENHLSISLNEILYKNEKILWQGKPTGKHLVQDSEKITTGISFIIYFVGELILLYKLLFTFSLSILLFFFFFLLETQWTHCDYFLQIQTSNQYRYCFLLNFENLKA